MIIYLSVHQNQKNPQQLVSNCLFYSLRIQQTIVLIKASRVTQTLNLIYREHIPFQAPAEPITGPFKSLKTCLLCFYNEQYHLNENKEFLRRIKTLFHHSKLLLNFFKTKQETVWSQPSNLFLRTTDHLLFIFIAAFL